MFTRLIAPALAALCMLLTISAASAAAPISAQQIFIDGIASDVLKIVKNDALGTDVKASQLESIFERAVDFDWVGRFVLGRHFKLASPAQQTAYLAAYKPFLIKNYVSRLTKYTGQTYKITGTKPASDAATLVMMQVEDPKGPPVLIDYRVDGKAGALKITDIVVEDVSLITTQRSEFNAFVSKNGIDKLIAALNKKTAAANVAAHAAAK